MLRASCFPCSLPCVISGYNLLCVFPKRLSNFPAQTLKPSVTSSADGNTAAPLADENKQINKKPKKKKKKKITTLSQRSKRNQPTNQPSGPKPYQPPFHHISRSKHPLPLSCRHFFCRTNHHPLSLFALLGFLAGEGTPLSQRALVSA